VVAPLLCKTPLAMDNRKFPAPMMAIFMLFVSFSHSHEGESVYYLK
jgi:hypothetical protein